MTTWTIYHNPKCSTSRAALQLLKDAGLEPKVVDYLKDRPSLRTMESLLKKLGMPAEGVLRRKEPLFQERFASRKWNDRKWLEVMLEHPELIERPIVVRNRKAIIGRPLERIEALIG
jgi:arsenate reductase